jgi:sortase B
MEPKQRILVIALSILFLFFAALTTSYGVRYIEEKNRPFQEATRQAEALATQVSNFYLTPSVQPSPTPTQLPDSIEDDLQLPTATVIPTPTPNPHAEELREALSLVDVDFPAWQSLNADIKAWIKNDSIRVDHPVLSPPDNEYYLTRDIDLSEKAMGSIFFDFRNKTDFSDPNTIVYGHNFDNGLMFSNLVRYKDQSFFERNPYYYIYTQDQVYRVDIAAGIVVSETDTTYLVVDFHSDLEFRSLIQKMYENSVIESNLELSPRDKLVTLYTCTNDWQGQRFVVIGKLTLLGSFSAT